MRKLRAGDYVELISNLQPDAYVALADEGFTGEATLPPAPLSLSPARARRCRPLHRHRVPPHADKPKRMLTAVNRTAGWLKETVERHKAAGLQALLFASVQARGVRSLRRSVAVSAAP